MRKRPRTESAKFSLNSMGFWPRLNLGCTPSSQKLPVNSGVGGRICGEAEESARRIEWVLEVFCLEKGHSA
jgi:hypothetical protein